MTRNARLSATRAWLHNGACLSDGCTGDNDHARRTQHAAARAFVDAPDDAARAHALHPSFCLAAARGHCEWADEHLARITDILLPALAAVTV